MAKSKEKKEEYGKSFIEWLNENIKTDYCVKINDEENKKDSDVDIYLNSVSGKYAELKIQLVTGEKYLREVEPKLEKERNQKPWRCLTMSPEWINGAIREKEGHYPKEVKKNLILLVGSDIGPLINEDYAKVIFQEFKQSDFLAIYWVHLPNQSNNGQIVVIKN